MQLVDATLCSRLRWCCRECLGIVVLLKQLLNLEIVELLSAVGFGLLQTWKGSEEVD